MRQSLGIYIHIPFCASKCGYCDFYSLAGCEHMMDKYQKALIAHLEEEKPARDFEFTEEDKDILADGGLLTIKPIIYAANLDENGMADVENNTLFLFLNLYNISF